ncbi:hypothetical protein IVB30_26090 [Bradyrhizobium sp. 200]|uniref:hypothetical protein n=1 Tax=Bradyrhizobium sp. 200 TaxID=2782665 RepID=UPI001FFFBFB4|nr:hypothetical protein [Bradyrhizobium sp. 200]UPJ46777.1 hypothetical protein IVB30_26090 [Bradyrhizobium sp. 200]
MDNTTIGIIGFLAMLLLMFLGVPIGVAMGIGGFIGFAVVNSWDTLIETLLSAHQE